MHMAHDPPTPLRYEDVSDALADHLPELREAYEAERTWWGDERPAPHVVYGDILNPSIDQLIQSGEERALRRVFEFVEVLSRSDDSRVQELVAVTVCEHLGADKQSLRVARRYMGRATLRLCDEVERFWKK